MLVVIFMAVRAMLRLCIGKTLVFWEYTMSTRNSQWSASGVKRLDFGGGGQAGRMEWVFGGALVVIIIGVIALLIYSQTGPGVKINTNPEIHLQCLNPECRNELVKFYKEFTEDEQRKISYSSMPMMPPMPGVELPPRMRCEKCDAIMGKQIQCPWEDCKKWYLDPTEVRFAVMDRTCPHCERDINQYWAQKSQEDEKKKK